MSSNNIPVFDAEETARRLDFAAMVREIKMASVELQEGRIKAPERQAVEFPEGGLMLSMPATAQDIGIHKLVNVVPNNSELGLPVIHGVVSAFDGATGKELCILHGQTVTTRRTAAVSMVGLDLFLNNSPQHVTIIGYGQQAIGHVQAVASLYPGIKVTVCGRNPDKAQAFIQKQKHLDIQLSTKSSIPDSSDVVITVTSSHTPVYTQPARASRLVVAVGAFRPNMAEISANTIAESTVYVDEPAGARQEAGDLIQANINWNNVKSIANAVQHKADTNKAIMYKTVGCAAWDLAAARAAMRTL